MSLSSDMMTRTDKSDLTWKALADDTRRRILDALADQPKTTGQLVKQFSFLSRTGVMKHLDVLQTAGLLIVRREGRLRWNSINPMPIQRIYDRWVAQHIRQTASAMSRLKDHVEKTPNHQTKKTCS